MKIWALVAIAFGLFSSSQCQENLYELLEVTEDATSEQIKKSFRKLSVKYHPDKNKDREDAQQFYLKIKRAYEVLIDVSKRNTYDLFGEEGLSQIQKHPKPKGGDYRPQMPVSLAKFYTGGPLTFSFRRGEICKKCKGTGDQGGELHPCEHCNGTGKMIRTVQVKDKKKQIQMKCNKCKGSGKSQAHVCPVCRGEKITMKPRDLNFEVEKGMVDGDKIMFKGESEQGFEFYPGDVIVTLRQQPHPYFTRVKNDLTTNVKIGLKQAILGFEKNIKQLDGRNVEIFGDEGVQDGETIVVEGEGMPIRGELGSYGNLLAQVNINFPKKYTKEQLDFIKRIFQAGEEEEDNEEL